MQTSRVNLLIAEPSFHLLCPRLAKQQEHSKRLQWLTLLYYSSSSSVRHLCLSLLRSKPPNPIPMAPIPQSLPCIGPTTSIVSSMVSSRSFRVHDRWFEGGMKEMKDHAIVH
ncbi:UNVERIFIED_CONTAM: hypothetical protein Slati_0173000 [Sesamum latifolium]|uniref:Uncharacterized protein n=1 Tax=Sesamum latifolium TaxID=2727402 RepID=A0AAW2YAW0_9LAMI